MEAGPGPRQSGSKGSVLTTMLYCLSLFPESLGPSQSRCTLCRLSGEWPSGLFCRDTAPCFPEGASLEGLPLGLLSRSLGGPAGPR